MYKDEIINKIFILDFTLFRKDIDRCVKDLINKNTSIKEPDFRTLYKVEKELINRVICRIINDTNDSPAYPLISPDPVFTNVNPMVVDNYANIIYTRLHIAFDRIFRFTENVEINIDSVISGNNVTVFTYENRLD